MRESSGASGFRLTATWAILIANIVCFLMLEIYRVSSTRASLEQFLAASPLALSLDGLKAGKIWQLLTFQFLHSGALHLFFNSLAIYFFGKPLEDALGRSKFVSLYFLSGTLGGLLNVAGSLLFPGILGKVSVVGASAGGFGLIAAFATLYPRRNLTLLVLLVLPVNIKAWLLLVIEAGLAIYGLIFAKDNIAHLAHLGGMLGGIGFIFARQRGFEIPSISWPQARKQDRPRQLVATAAPGPKAWAKVPPAEEVSPEEYISREVDPILDKISAHGIHSLTERERRILEAARKRMSGR